MSSDGIFWGRARVESPAFSKIWRDIHTVQNANPVWWAGIVEQIKSLFCDCGDFLETYIAENPPRFNDWFKWSWELHNAVNRKLGKQQQTFDDAKACWLTEAPQTKPRLVITIATGPKFVALHNLTRPPMEAYAARCDADFLAITNQQFDQWQREKFRVYDFAKQYEQTLFLDADVLIKDTADNLFEVYRGADIAMHDDLPRNPWAQSGQWDWKQEHSEVLRSQAIADYAPDLLMWNSGIVLTSRKGTEIWKPPSSRLASSHCSEQFYVQHQCRGLGLSVRPMASVHNWQWWFPDFADGVDDCQFIHLANCPSRIEWIADYRSKAAA